MAWENADLHVSQVFSSSKRSLNIYGLLGHPVFVWFLTHLGYKVMSSAVGQPPAGPMGWLRSACPPSPNLACLQPLMKVWRGEGGHLRGGSAGPGGERPPAAARGNSGSADGANKRRRQPRAPRSPTRGRGVGAPGAGSGPRASAPNTELVGEGGKEAKGWGSPTRRWDPPAPAQPRTPPSLLSETSAAAWRQGPRSQWAPRVRFWEGVCVCVCVRARGPPLAAGARPAAVRARCRGAGGRQAASAAPSAPRPPLAASRSRLRQRGAAGERRRQQRARQAAPRGLLPAVPGSHLPAARLGPAAPGDAERGRLPGTPPPLRDGRRVGTAASPSSEDASGSSRVEVAAFWYRS